MVLMSSFFLFHWGGQELDVVEEFMVKAVKESSLKALPHCLGVVLQASTVPWALLITALYLILTGTHSFAIPM